MPHGGDPAHAGIAPGMSMQTREGLEYLFCMSIEELEEEESSRSEALDLDV
jgi:hypothetical protein